VHNIHAYVLPCNEKEYTSLLQIYSATFPPHIIEIGQHLT